MLVARMLLQSGAVRRLLEILSTCLADDGFGCCVRLQLRRRSLGTVLAVAVALRLCFGAVAHFAEDSVGWRILLELISNLRVDVKPVHGGFKNFLQWCERSVD